MYEQSQLIFYFDLIGTVIFAITGAISGIKLRLDMLGVIVFACTVGVGGGILRDVVIGAVPVTALQNEVYLIACILTGLIIFLCSKHIIHHRQIITYCDAFGLGVFTALGAAKGAQFQLDMIGITLCAVLSAVGGGILRDIMARKIPTILTSDFYATASLIGGVMYYYLNRNEFSIFFTFIIVSTSVVLIRLLAISFRLRLPRAKRVPKLRPQN